MHIKHTETLSISKCQLYNIDCIRTIFKRKNERAFLNLGKKRKRLICDNLIHMGTVCETKCLFCMALDAFSWYLVEFGRHFTLKEIIGRFSFCFSLEVPVLGLPRMNKGTCRREEGAQLVP